MSCESKRKTSILLVNTSKNSLKSSNSNQNCFSCDIFRVSNVRYNRINYIKYNNMVFSVIMEKSAEQSNTSIRSNCLDESQ